MRATACLIVENFKAFDRFGARCLLDHALAKLEESRGIETAYVHVGTEKSDLETAVRNLVKKRVEVRPLPKRFAAHEYESLFDDLGGKDGDALVVMRPDTPLLEQRRIEAVLAKLSPKCHHCCVVYTVQGHQSESNLNLVTHRIPVPSLVAVSNARHGTDALEVSWLEALSYNDSVQRAVIRSLVRSGVKLPAVSGN